MPDKPNDKPHLHPVRCRRVATRAARRGRPYAELHCRSNFSFLEGASHPEELCARAAELGYAALAVTDRNSLAGIVRAHLAAKSSGLRLIVGAEITPVDAPPLVLLPSDRAAYGRLCRLITRGRRRVAKGQCEIRFGDVEEFAEGQIAIAMPCDDEALSRYRSVFGDRLYLAAELHRTGDIERQIGDLLDLSRRHRVPLVAANDVHYHEPGRRPLQDVLTCIREHCTLATAGRRLLANAERHLRPLEEIERLYARLPEAIERTDEAAGRCRFSLDELRYEYPEELCPPGTTPLRFLRELTWAGARERFGEGLPTRIRTMIEHELQLIEELRYESYFLTVWDLVRFARSRDILCQGRGSAANSAVCYCLGVTAVDPERIELLFERFVSRERNEPPDIDVDFEHERREEVFQYIYGKYGRERAGITAEVITYRPKSAVRDVGKALGFSQDRVDALSKQIDWWSPDKLPPERLREAGLDPNDPTVLRLVDLVRQIAGFPRHLSQHVGGFVITRSPLCEMVPIENGGMPDRTFIEWDKDDIDALGILKVDCLALGMLTCLHRAMEYVNEENRAARSLTLESIPPEDPAVYDMLCRADSVGVFQVESRAQMSMLPRLKPRCFYDLVIEVAIVRPGPIQGGMVHPYLRRRAGEEPISYPSPAIQEVLGKTLGVPLFQEQAMRLAVVAAGFTPGEADRLRRAMAAWRRAGTIDAFRKRFVEGAIANGLPRGFAEQTFEQIRGFGEYGFPESHAASFALLVYASAWLKLYHPAAFAAALINSQPMGFYAPAQIVRDAQRHGVEVRRIDVNFSGYDCVLEEMTRDRRQKEEACEARRTQYSVLTPQSLRALRIGMRLVKGISREAVRGIESARRDGPFRSVVDLARRSGASRGTLARLAAADAFRSMGLDRRQALWEVLALRDEPPLLAGLDTDEPPAPLPAMPLADEVVSDYEATGLSLTAHPLSLLRPALNRMRVATAAQVANRSAGEPVRVAGLVLVRQRPGTASGIVFATLEDETGITNLILRPRIFEHYRRVVPDAIWLADGRIERAGEVVHVQVSCLRSLREPLAGIRLTSRDFH